MRQHSLDNANMDCCFQDRRRQHSLPSYPPSDTPMSEVVVANKGRAEPPTEKPSSQRSSPNTSNTPNNGVRGLLRRASFKAKSIGRGRRHSSNAVEPLEEATSPVNNTWHRKLRQAASFSLSLNKRLSTISIEEYSEAESIESPLAKPIPGNGKEPPIIPRGYGGAAARATAAAQNEFYGRTRFLQTEDRPVDRESGVHISLDPTVLAPYQGPDETISRVDFVKLLPPELTSQVLSHLDLPSLMSVELVAKHWIRAARDSLVWRDVFCREKSKTYAMGRDVAPGSGLGVPAVRAEKDWKKIYRVRQQLEKNWAEGNSKAVYLNGHQDSIYCVQFDENKIITGSRDKTIRIWNVRTYECERVIGPFDVITRESTLRTEDGNPCHYATTPDGKKSGISMPRTSHFDMCHAASVLCLQFDDEILVTGSSDSTCIVHDIADDYKPIRRLHHHTAAVLDLAFDKKYIVTCSKDVTICVWDRATGVMLKQLQGHSGPVNAVQMRGNSIVSCSGDFKVKLWNIDTGKAIREFVGHTKGLACSQFSDDSRYIASAGNDMVIRIWDAMTGDCVKQIKAHENLVRSLWVDSVSGRLVSASYDQDIKVFDMESGRLLLDFPKWHASWVLGAKSDYRRIISTGQIPKILIMDFGANVEDIEMLES